MSQPQDAGASAQSKRTLLVFGPLFDQPDPSPFVVKAMVLMKMAGLAFEAVSADVRKTPKRKLPVLIDQGKTIADSTFIRFHIEDVYGFDFDAGLTPDQRAIAWLTDKAFEDHFYWIAVSERWTIDRNFKIGPRRLFDTMSAPGPVRSAVAWMVQRDVRRALAAQGMGRHSRDEQMRLARRLVQNFEALLGDKPYLMGDRPCGADATAFAFISAAAVDVFDSPLKDMIESAPSVLAYRDRGAAQWFPNAA